MTGMWHEQTFEVFFSEFVQGFDSFCTLVENIKKIQCIGSTIIAYKESKSCQILVMNKTDRERRVEYKYIM